jgi:microcystin-dependent protein
MSRNLDLINMVQASSSSGGFAAPGIITAWTALPTTGWLYCNGSQISRTVYDLLFAEIAVTWGVGDGSTTFNVPDLRGAFLRGTGSHGASTMAAGAAFAGPSVGAYQNDGIQLHGHSIRLHTAGATNGVSLGYLSAPTVKTGQVTDLNTSSAGTPRGEQENRPFNAGVHFCIKYD